MSSTTTISVRALAFGGKFVGQHVGFAMIDIYGPDDADKPLASGRTDQGLVANTDGSGVTPLIMDQPYLWGYPVRADEATEFTAEIALTEPTVLTFVATSVADPRIAVSCKRLVIPNVKLTGAMAVVIVIPGLLTALTEPAASASIVAGTPTTITAQVRMMCGCMIDNLFWPAANFNVQAIISNAGNEEPLTLSYGGQPSLFSAPYTFPAPGDYSIRIVATEFNGNLGATSPVMVNVKQNG
ncbi:MAG TPA: hypothetical protein VFX97_04725 [Pyrinomonadaceae bacterium]|nr:hypothetical protein [Pyrinomonadaceae bacterium]